MDQHRVASGIYVGRGIAGSEQYGTSKQGNDQIAIDLALSDIGESVTTFLVFTEKNAPYCVERLRVLGWEGDDLSHLVGIDKNDVNVEVKYEAWEGKERMKVQIITGGGRVVLKETLDDRGKKAFAAKFKGLVVASKGNGAPAGAPGGLQHPKQTDTGVKL